MLKCIFKIPKYAIIFFSNCVFSFKIIFKQWLQVIKSVNYIFFTHFIDSKIL